MSDEPQRPATDDTKVQEPDDSGPTKERQAELRAAYEANMAQGKAPYDGVRIHTRGELRWVLNERGWFGGIFSGHLASDYVLGTTPADLRGVVLLDLSPCLKAGDSWAEHSGPGMLARRQNAVTGLHVHWGLGCRPRSTGVDSRRPCGMQAV